LIPFRCGWDNGNAKDNLPRAGFSGQRWPKRPRTTLGNSQHYGGGAARTTAPARTTVLLLPRRRYALVFARPSNRGPARGPGAHLVRRQRRLGPGTPWPAAAGVAQAPTATAAACNPWPAPARACQRRPARPIRGPGPDRW